MAERLSNLSLSQKGKPISPRWVYSLRSHFTWLVFQLRTGKSFCTVGWKFFSNDHSHSRFFRYAKKSSLQVDLVILSEEVPSLPSLEYGWTYNWLIFIELGSMLYCVTSQGMSECVCLLPGTFSTEAPATLSDMVQQAARKLRLCGKPT